MTGAEQNQTFGPYRLLRELGRGGQGAVWLAEDNKLKRRVALKVLHAVAGTIDEARLLRFRREAESAAKLDDPHICALLDAGDEDGVPYLAFRYVEGETLAERIARSYEAKESVSDDVRSEVTDPSSREGMQATVRTFEKIARALHKAHEQGLIHRDVKPGNVMLTADGDPVILDFGLAHDELADDHTLTRSGDLLGTPAYMSPEQITAQRIPVDRRTDVYSLGATLYEALTLRRPFAATTRAELYQRILTAEPSSVHSVNSQVPRDLQVVIETAMEKDRNRRYQTALAFAEDLERVRRFEPITARPIGRMLRLRRWGQRHPALATGLVATLLLLVGGLVAALALIEQQGSALTRQRALLLASASAEAAPTNPKLALKLALAAEQVGPRRETVSQLQAALSVQHERAVIRTQGAADPSAVDVSPDGDRIVTADRDGTTPRLWDLYGNLLVEFVGHEARVQSVAFSPDGRVVLTTSDDGTARLWDVGGDPLGRPLEGHGDIVWDGAFSPDFDHDAGRGAILTASKRGTARLWRPTGELIRELEDHSAGVCAVEFSPNYEADGLFVTAALDGSARLWHKDRIGSTELGGLPENAWLAVRFSPTGDRLATWIDVTRSYLVATAVSRALIWRVGVESPVVLRASRHVVVHDVSFSPDSRRVTTSLLDNRVVFWDLDGRERGGLAATSAMRSARFSSDGTSIVTGSHDQLVRLFDPKGRELARLAGHGHRVVWARFCRGDRQIVSGAQDGTVRVWNVAPAGFPMLRGHGIAVQHVRFSEHDHGARLISSGEDGVVRVWDIAEGSHARLEGHEDIVRWASFSPRGDRILTASVDGSVRLWNADGRGIRTLCQLTAAFQSVEWHPEGDGFLTASSGSGDVGSVRLWGLDGQERQRFDLPAAYRAVFSPTFRDDGLILAGGEWVRLLHRDGHVVHERRAERGFFWGVGFSRDAQRFVASSGDRTVRMWSIDGELLWTFEGHDGPVHSVECSPTDDLVVTASRDGTVRILDFDGEEQMVIRSPDGFFLHATFSPDGRRIATGSVGPSIRLWHVYAEDLRELAEARVEPFTDHERERFADLLPESAR